jgi:uncharacterized OB-fold protein
MTLLHRDPNAPASWKGELPVTNRYTYGLAGEKFFRTLKDEGRILGTHCPHCDVRAWSSFQNAACKLTVVDVGLQGGVSAFTYARQL